MDHPIVATGSVGPVGPAQPIDQPPVRRSHDGT